MYMSVVKSITWPELTIGRTCIRLLTLTRAHTNTLLQLKAPSLIALVM